MEILVNQEPLNYSLENEELLGQVVDGLAEWLRVGRYAITAINVDDRSVPIHDRTFWQDVEVESVETLSIEALPLSQVEQTTVAAIADYCVLLRRALAERDQAAVADLSEELPFVRARLAALFPELRPSRAAGELLADPELENGALPDPEPAARLEKQLDGITVILEARLREYASPEQELALTLGQLVACVDPLVDVPVQLQTGNESAAMNTVIGFTEHLSRAIRLLPLVRDPTFDVEAIRSFATGLTPHLLELQAAFEAQDTVLIGDILEYEIAPRVSELPALFPPDGPDTDQTTAAGEAKTQ